MHSYSKPNTFKSNFTQYPCLKKQTISLPFFVLPQQTDKILHVSQIFWPKNLINS